MTRRGLRRRTAYLGLLLFLLLPSAITAQHLLSPADDREVIAAVMEQSIVPYVTLEREIAAVPGGPVLVVSQSTAACTGTMAPPDCADVSGLTSADAQGFVTGAWDYREETRVALVESFRTRNQQSERLPLPGGEAIATFPSGEAARAAAGARIPGDLVIELSLPGYTSNGFAIMYGQASRQGRPLQGWAFLLSRASGRWAVQHAYLLWIRQ